MTALQDVFSKNLRYYRYKRNFTQEKLAELTDLGVYSIQSFERGRYNPTFDSIEALASALDIEPYMLFQETSNTHKKLPPKVTEQKVPM